MLRTALFWAILGTALQAAVATIAQLAGLWTGIAHHQLQQDLYTYALLGLVLNAVIRAALPFFLLCLYRERFHRGGAVLRQIAAWAALILWMAPGLCALFFLLASKISGRPLPGQAMVGIGKPFPLVAANQLAWTAFLLVFVRRRADPRTRLVRGLAVVLCAVTAIQGLRGSYGALVTEIRYWPGFGDWLGSFSGLFNGLVMPAAFLLSWVPLCVFFYATWRVGSRDFPGEPIGA